MLCLSFGGARDPVQGKPSNNRTIFQSLRVLIIEDIFPKSMFDIVTFYIYLVWVLKKV